MNSATLERQWIEIVIDPETRKPIINHKDGMEGIRIKREDGTEVNERVTFYVGLGWSTEEEIFAEKQQFPRSPFC